MADIFHSCRQQGINTINLDLMYGFVNQTKEEIEATMKVVGRLMPEHLTVYELRTNMLNRYPIATAEQRFEQYSYLYDLITRLGYKGRFGMNTFSLIGDYGLSSYLQHRMIKNGSYKGFGIAAQSKNDTGLSYNIGKNGESLECCLSRSTFEKDGDSYILPPRELLSKYIAISGYCGMTDLSVMEKILHSDPNMVFEKELAFFCFITGLVNLIIIPSRAVGDYVYLRSSMLSPSVGDISSLKSVMPASTRMLYQVMSFLMSLL